MPKETKFRKKTEQYIETGSYEGYSIQLALDSGFSKVYSIELFDKYYDHSKDNNRLQKLPIPSRQTILNMKLRLPKVIQIQIF